MIVDAEKMKLLINSAMSLGFQMGATSMRLKVMETLTPYLDNNLLDSELLTIRDIIKLVGDTLIEYKVDEEFVKMKNVVDGLSKLDGNHD